MCSIKLFYLPYRFVITEVRALNHPFHIHGFPFAVMGMYQPVDDQRLTRTLAESIHSSKSMAFKTLDDIPPLKDTVSIPSKGYAVVRFRATNPGKFSFNFSYPNIRNCYSFEIVRFCPWNFSLLLFAIVPIYPYINAGIDIRSLYNFYWVYR